MLNRCLSGELIESDGVLNTEWGAIFLTCMPAYTIGEAEPIGAVVMEFNADVIYKSKLRAMLYSGALALVIVGGCTFITMLCLRRLATPFYKKLAYTDMLTGIGKGTITREEVSADYLKRLFARYGVIVSAKPEQRRLLELVNDNFDLGLEIPETLKLFQLSEQHRRLVVINVQGLRRKNGSLLPEYTEEEFNEATFIFVKYYIQGRHYDELVEENKKLQFELDQEVEWRNRTDNG